jgi:hypothetical protein
MALQHHRDTDVTVRILREFYGSFAPHCADNEKLSDVIPKLDCPLARRRAQ